MAVLPPSYSAAGSILAILSGPYSTRFGGQKVTSRHIQPRSICSQPSADVLHGQCITRPQLSLLTTVCTTVYILVVPCGRHFCDFSSLFLTHYRALTLIVSPSHVRKRLRRSPQRNGMECGHFGTRSWLCCALNHPDSVTSYCTAPVNAFPHH